MISIDDAFRWQAILLYACVAFGVWYAFEKGWIRGPLVRRETAVLAKLLFIPAALMVIVAVRNSVSLPAGQFIYGRF